MSRAKSQPEDAAKGTQRRGRKGRGADADADDSRAPLSVAGDPRARRNVRVVKAWAGLIGFGLALILSLRAEVPLAMAAERALAAGIAGYLVAWACAVAVWRALLIAELRARVEAIKAARERAAAAK